MTDHHLAILSLWIAAISALVSFLDFSFIC